MKVINLLFTLVMVFNFKWSSKLHHVNANDINHKQCGGSYGSCTDDYCCSKYGYCGKTDDYCGIGCQASFGKCNKITTTIKKTTQTTNNNKATQTINHKQCGGSHGSCTDGYCCSKYGYCGKTDDHCGIGCQANFGKCNKITTTIKKTTQTTNNNKATQTINHKQCGGSFGSCTDGYCCSKFGWCGNSNDHCGSGCQKNFGRCNQ